MNLFPGSSRKRSGSFSRLFRRKSSSGIKDPNQESINLDKIFGVRIKRRRKAGQNEEDGFVLGLGLFTFEWKDVNTLREREIYFEHPSVEICTRWSEKLNQYLNSKYFMDLIMLIITHIISGLHVNRGHLKRFLALALSSSRMIGLDYGILQNIYMYILYM